MERSHVNLIWTGLHIKKILKITTLLFGKLICYVFEFVSRTTSWISWEVDDLRLLNKQYPIQKD